MSTTAQEVKANKQKTTVKFSTRKVNRCPICGRSRSYHRYFAMCRICLRDRAHNGEIPGVRKSSW